MGVEPTCPPNDGHTGFEDRETHRGLSTPADSLVPDAVRGQVEASERPAGLLAERPMVPRLPACGVVYSTTGFSAAIQIGD